MIVERYNEGAAKEISPCIWARIWPWPIASTYLSERLVRKKQNKGGCGSFVVYVHPLNNYSRMWLAEFSPVQHTELIDLPISCVNSIMMVFSTQLCYQRRIHERKISLRFLGIIFRVLRLEVSIYNVYITNQFQTIFARGGGSKIRLKRWLWIARRKTLETLSQIRQEFGLRWIFFRWWHFVLPSRVL